MCRKYRYMVVTLVVLALASPFLCTALLAQNESTAASGVTTPDPMDPSVSLEALKKVGEAARVYLDEYQTMMPPPEVYYYLSDEDLAARRPQWAVPLLNGLRVLLDNRIPSVAPEPPMLPVFAWGPDQKAQIEANQGLIEAALAARQKAIYILQEPLGLRQAFISDLVMLYSRTPYDTEELRQLATERLKDPAVVNEIIGWVEAAIAAKAQAQ